MTGVSETQASFGSFCACVCVWRSSSIRRWVFAEKRLSSRAQAEECPESNTSVDYLCPCQTVGGTTARRKRQGSARNGGSSAAEGCPRREARCWSSGPEAEAEAEAERQHRHAPHRQATPSVKGTLRIPKGANWGRSIPLQVTTTSSKAPGS